MNGGHLKAFIEFRGHKARGALYRVRMNTPTGMVIIESTTEPAHATARALLSKGVRGQLEIWDSCRSYPRMRGDIERMAAFAVSEGQDGIALRKYAERTADGDFDLEPSDSPENETGRPARAAQAFSGIREVAA